MKKTILFLAVTISLLLTAFIAVEPASTPMSYKTLGGIIDKSTVNPTGTGWKFSAYIWIGVNGNTYTKQQANGEWTGFVEKVYLPVIIASELDTAIMNKAMVDSIDAYRKRKYPDVK